MTLPPYRTVGDVLRRWDTAEQPERSHLFHKHEAAVLECIRRTKPGEGPFRYRQTWVRLHADQPSFTVMACHGGVFLHPWRDRCLSPRELAVLQDFSDDYVFFGNKSDLWREIGNAVPISLGRAVGVVCRQMLTTDEQVEASSLPPYRTLRDTIGGMPEPLPALMPGNRANPEGALAMLNHEYFVGGYSSRYMERNRRRGWDELGFTVLASGRHAAQHPASDPMQSVNGVFHFTGRTRRLSVRESAKIQGFPDDFRFIYARVDDGYKMVGNAVPIPLAVAVGTACRQMLMTGEQALLPVRTFRDAVGDLPEMAVQAGETVVEYATSPQNDFQRRMRFGAVIVTEHAAAHHGAKMVELLQHIPEGQSAQDPEVYAKIPAHLRPGRSFQNSYARISWDQPVPTITRNFSTPSSASCIHPSQPRGLTIREAARCQSFADTYKFTGTTGRKRLLIGNAVPPLLAKAIGHALSECLATLENGTSAHAV